MRGSGHPDIVAMAHAEFQTDLFMSASLLDSQKGLYLNDAEKSQQRHGGNSQYHSEQKPFPRDAATDSAGQGNPTPSANEVVSGRVE